MYLAPNPVYGLFAVGSLLVSLRCFCGLKRQPGMTAGDTDYKWILYGDDDTVFFVDNVISLVSGLDYRKPYFISDCLWFPQGGNGKTSKELNQSHYCSM